MPRTALIATLLLWLQLSHVGASLRHHGRHRREPGPRADANPQSQFLAPREHLLKEEQKQNIFKPKFERCKEYQPEVEEEESRGRTFVLFFTRVSFFKCKMRGTKLQWINKWGQHFFDWPFFFAEVLTKIRDQTFFFYSKFSLVCKCIFMHIFLQIRGVGRSLFMTNCEMKNEPQHR